MLSFISVCLSKRSETGRKFGKDFKLSDNFQMAALIPKPVQISEWFLIFSVTALRLCEILQEGILSLKATFTYAWSGDGRILTFPLRYRGYVHTYAERTPADLPSLEGKDGMERAVSNQTRKIGCSTHLLRSGFCSRSASAPRPRMCEHM